MSTPRRPRSAAGPRALPSLEHVAALLAAGGLAVAPVLAYVLRDTGCVEAGARGVWSRMEARGVFRSATTPGGDTYRECPVMEVSGPEPPPAPPPSAPPPPAPANPPTQLPNLEIDSTSALPVRPPRPQRVLPPSSRSARYEVRTAGDSPSVSEIY